MLVSFPKKRSIVTVGLSAKLSLALEAVASRRAWYGGLMKLDIYPPKHHRVDTFSEGASGQLIVFINVDEEPELVRETVAYYSQVESRPSFLIAVAKDESSKAILRAMRAGCSEFISEPFTDSTVELILDRVEELPLSINERVQASEAKIVALIGGKGGVGTTTLCGYLATSVVKGSDLRILVVDAHANLGNITNYLGLDRSKGSFIELARNVHRLDRDLLSGFTLKHRNGLEILAASDEVSTPVDLTQLDIRNTLLFLRGEYDIIFIDVTVDFGPMLSALLEFDVDYQLVGVPDVASVRGISRARDFLASRSVPDDRVNVIMNRFDMEGAVKISKIEEALKRSVTISVPDETEVVLQACNMGRIDAESQLKPIERAMQKWSASLYSQSLTELPIEPRKKRFGFWR